MLIESIIQRPQGTRITLGQGAEAAEYHFRPDAEGRHVCVVEYQPHAAALLAIRDGFRCADGSAAGALTDAAFVADEIEGAFFIVRGPQDLQAFAHWVSAIPDMANEVSEYVLLIDKIAIGEANLGRHALPTDIPDLSLGLPQGDTPAPDLSPRAPATNTILPSDHHHEGAASEHVGGAASGDAGAGAADGAGADPDAEDGDDEDAEATKVPAGELDREALAKEYDELFGHRPNGRWTAEKIAAAIADKQAKG